MITKKEFYVKLFEDRGVEKILLSLRDGNFFYGFIKKSKRKANVTLLR